MLYLLILLPAEAAKPAKVDREAMITGAAKVAAAVTAAAKANQQRDRPLRGDALTEQYLQAAATAADRLEKEKARAFLLGIGVALDTSGMLRTNPLTRGLWKRVENDEARKARLKVLGHPPMHARHDLCQHFVVSAALTAVGGARAAEAAGLLKELLDADPGGSGFSFADLAADLSGIALAQALIDKPARLAGLSRRCLIADVCVAPKGLVEGLSLKELERRFGDTKDKRFVAEVDRLKKKVQALAWHKP